jgi:class 3 adenylate cyclase
VAERLKNGEHVVAEAHECVTILFADIVGFTKMSAVVKTADLFEMLNRLYTEFDSLADKHGVHKVDTIGDGVRTPSPSPPLCTPALSASLVNGERQELIPAGLTRHPQPFHLVLRSARHGACQDAGPSSGR